MTGYGKAEQIFQSRKISVEIKTLNSKQLDLAFKIPQELRANELEYRNIISEKLQRGKIDVTISIVATEVDDLTKIDSDVVFSYKKQIEEISNRFGIPEPKDLAMLIFRMQGIFSVVENEYDKDFEEKIKETLLAAIEMTDEFRKHEGEVLKKDLVKRVELILDYLGQVEPFEAQRCETIRQHLVKHLAELPESKYDENRLEQELIYYLEKLDITEEKVRLRKHCNYFFETVDETGAGKKLGFIAQEMGREINTLGSKANNAEIQRIVVNMKDELEKIKEQLFNIL